MSQSGTGRRAKHLGERPLAWLAPLFAFLALFYLYPLVEVVRLSFTNATSALAPYRYTLASYTSVLASPESLTMLRVTALFVVVSVAGQLLAGLLISALLIAGERRRLPGAALVRGVVLLGWVLPGVVLGIMWKLLLDESPSGLATYGLSFLGVRDPVFLSSAGPALVWVTVANIWRGTAFSMLVQYAAMKTVPVDLYEAGTLDGAGAWQQFVYITLPSIRRIVLVNLVLITIATLNTFDMIVPLTGGGPGRATEVVALFIYDTVFMQFLVGRGAALAVLLGATGVAFMVIYFKLFFDKSDAEPA